MDDYKTAHNHVGRRDALVVTIAAADCDCTGILRTFPTLVTHNGAVSDGGTTVAIPEGVVDQVASELLNPKIRKCFSSGNNCNNSGSTYVVKNTDNSQLNAAFLSSTGTHVVVTPTNGDYVGTHNLRIVMTNQYGLTIEYDRLDIVITCTIASINNVAAPSTNLQYVLYESTHSVDLSGSVYTQTPDCRFVLTMAHTWTIGSSAPIVVNSGNP